MNGAATGLLRAARTLLRGEAQVAHPLADGTLDEEDANVARAWLHRPGRWGEEATVRRFEEAFALWNGSPRAFAFMSGREALTACLRALGLGEGDEVILPGYTCVVVQNALLYEGIRPVHCDIELETFGPDVASVERRVTKRTRAILIHHLYGLVCRDYEPLLALARDRGVRTIEDCAHATGALYRGERVGTRGDVAFYSSERSKVFNTIQGGIAVARDGRIAERLRACRDVFRPPEDAWTARQLSEVQAALDARAGRTCRLRSCATLARRSAPPLPHLHPGEEDGIRPPGYGRRMNAPVAALGLVQLAKIDRYNAERRATARTWEAWCRSRGYVPPRVVWQSEPAFLRYPVLVEAGRKRDTTWARRSHGVELGVWFTSPLHPTPCRLPECPRAEEAVRRCVNFPGLLR